MNFINKISKMNKPSPQIQLEKINTASINIIHEQVNNNNEELEKIKKLVDENKNNGHKIPLLATVLLLFHNVENSTLTKSDLYSLMEKETRNNKNAIISSPTDRYSIINPRNFKSKIKDILKKKKWFTKKVNDSNEIEFTLNPRVISSIIPRITSFFKVLAKNGYLFINKEEEEEIEVEDNSEKNLSEPKKEKNDDNTEEEKDKNKKKKKTNKKSTSKEKHKKKEKKSKKNINVKKEKEIEKKIDPIEDFEIIIEDDENFNNMSFINTEERHIIPKIEEPKIEKCENHSVDIVPEFLDKKRKRSKKKANKKSLIEKRKKKSKKEVFSSSLSNNENKLSLKEETPNINIEQIDINDLDEKELKNNQA